MKSLEEIHKIREEKRKELDLRVNTKADTKSRRNSQNKRRKKKRIRFKS